MPPQVERRGQAHPGRDHLHRQIGVLQQNPRRLDAPRQQPLPRTGPDLTVEPAREGARRHPGPLRQIRNRDTGVQARRRPVQDLGQTVGPGPGRRVGELALSALASRRHHHVPGHFRGVGRAVVCGKDVKAQVDSGGGSGTCGHIPVVDVQHVGVHLDKWEPARQFLGHPPVGRCPPAVQQSGGRHHERARADRQNPHTAAVRPPHHRQDLRRRTGLPLQTATGNHERVGTIDRRQILSGLDGIPGQGRHRPRLLCADREIVPRFQSRAGDPEHLGGARQLESRLWRLYQRHHPVRSGHGMNISNSVITATGGGLRPRRYSTPWQLLKTLPRSHSR